MTAGRTPAGLPPSVADTLDRYVRATDRFAPDLVAGVHLIGSAALGDFRIGRSDLDVVVVVRRPLERRDRQALVRAEAAIQASGVPALDGLYVTPDDLQRDPVAGGPGWWTRGGRLRGPSMEMRTPVVWAELARHAVTVAGPLAAALGVHDDPRALDAWLRANLQGYWRRWIARARPLDAVGVLSRLDGATVWGALGVSRIHHTLATGEIVSKTAAGRHARDRFGPEFRPLLERALALRTGEPPPEPLRRRSPELLRFMTHVINDALRLPERRPGKIA